MLQLVYCPWIKLDFAQIASSHSFGWKSKFTCKLNGPWHLPILFFMRTTVKSTDAVIPSYARTNSSAVSQIKDARITSVTN